MGKTPGQIKYEASQGIAEFKIPWEKITPYAKEIWELQAAAARPQIEAEAMEKIAYWLNDNGFKTGNADTIQQILIELTVQLHERINRERAVAIEECAKIADGRLFSANIEEDIRALSTLPPGFACVPVEPTKEMMRAAHEDAVSWSKTLRPMQPLNAETWDESCRSRWKAMVAAAKVKP